MCKRIIAALLSLVMLLSCIPVMAFAEDHPTATLTVSDIYTTPGSTVTIDVMIDDNPGILGATLKLSWDDGLTLTGCENGTAFSELTFQKPSRYQNGCNFVWYGSSIAEAADGIILSLTFVVEETATDADAYDISITYGSGDVVDENYAPVDLTVKNGSIRIVTYTPGDVTGDGRVNTLDLIKLCQYISDGCVTDPEGFNVTLNESAADVNDDGKLNPLDLILISQYISDGCVTNPDGYNVTLKPSTPKCKHKMTKVDAKDETCTEEGNVEYWFCGECGKSFDSKDGDAEISLEDVVVEAKGHTVVIDKAVAPTYTTPGKTEGSHCADCLVVFIAQEDIPVLEGFHIEYNILGTDTYLAQQNIVNPNPSSYTPENDTIVLRDLVAPAGYEFLGWYDAPQSVGGTRITQIPKGSSGDITLHAHWNEIDFDITYKLYQTPLGEITDEKYLHYTVSKGLKDLPNPELYNYVFLGWYLEDGTEMTEIPVGTTGHLTLNAYWTSKRNLAKAKSSLDDPIIIENIDDGVIYFAYELGTIENVPLSDAIWTIQSVSGLAQQTSVTVSTTISQEQAKEISEMISRTTVDSATWTLSKDWNNVTEVNEEWAEENGMTQEEANIKTKSESGTYSITNSNGGCSTTTENDGTTTVGYNSQNKTHGNSAEFNAKIHANYTSTAEVGVDAKIAEVSLSNQFEIGGEIGGGYKQQQETDEHTGTDTTTIDTTVTSNETSWNKSSTSSNTKAASESIEVKEALSSIISNSKGYGESYSSGGANSESQEFSSSDNQSVSSSSTLTYFSSETKTTTNTYSTDGKSEGCYRLVVAGKVHVFGVVGYDIATHSYFTYTFNVLDDKTYEFLDYSPTLSFDDYENCALPFEIPYFVHEYVTAKTVSTEGLTYKTNSADNTAMVVGFENDTISDVVIPSYISSGMTAYKVTGISASAFAGKPIRSIVLSDHIDVIPAGAFKNCCQLEQISGYFTAIGDEAFSGCTSLESYTVSSRVSEIGVDAFMDVPSIKVNALNSDAAKEKAKKDLPGKANAEQIDKQARTYTQQLVNAVVSSGAENIVLDISKTIEGVVFTIDVPEINSFELVGGKRTFKDLRLKSKANTTVLKEITINECTRIPLDISSKNLTMEVVDVCSQGYALLLSSSAPTITLIRDNKLAALAGRAMVCKNPSIISKTVDNAIGTLVVSGNMYVNGTADEIARLKQSASLTVTNGDIIAITASEYSQYIKGAFNVTFNANGGTVSENSRIVYFGTAIGALPVPKRDYYTFQGWYTSAEGGTRVTDTTAFTSAMDTTIYAQWKLNEVTMWVKASEMPQDAQVVSRKWSYTKTHYTTSTTSSTMSGWSLYNTTSAWSEYGAWSEWQDGVVTGSDSRQVETQKVISGYEKKTQYFYDRYYYKNSNDGYYYAWPFYAGECINYESTGWLDYALTVNGTDNYSGKVYTEYGFGQVNGKRIYWYNQRTRQVDDVSKPIYKTQYRYRDRTLIYTYYFKRTENLELGTYPTGNDISNIQEWVQYRPK